MRRSPRLRGNGERSDAGNRAPASVPRTPHHPRTGAALDALIRSIEDEWQLGITVRGLRSPAQNRSTADKAYSRIQHLFYSARPALDDALKSFTAAAPGFAQEARLELLYGMLKSKTLSPISRVGTPLGLGSEPQKSLLSASQSSQPGDLTRDAGNDEHESYATAVDPGSPTDEDTDNEFVTPQSPQSSPSPTPASRSVQRQVQASPFVSLRNITRKRPSDSSNDSGNSPKLTKTSKGKQALNAYMPGPIPTPSLFKIPSLNMARSFQAAAASVISSVNTSFNATVASSQETIADTVNTSFTSHDGATDSDIQYPKLPQTSSTTMGPLDDHDLLGIMVRPETEAFKSQEQRELARLSSQELSRDSISTFGSVDEDGLRDASCRVEGEARPTFGLKPTAPSNGRQARGSPIQARPTVDTRVFGSVTTSFPPPGASTGTLSSEQPILRPRSSSVGVPPLRSRSGPQRTNTPADSPSKMAYYIRELPNQNLFVEPLADELLGFPFFLLFICCRISISNGVPLRQLMQTMDMGRVQSNPDAFWSTIGRSVQQGPRDPNMVWTAAKKSFEGYTFKGRVIFNRGPKPSGSVFKLELLPIEPERSCLFQRMFGSDRFLYLTFPSFRETDKSGRFNSQQMQQIEEQWKLWLLQTHSFLGRKWRVFHMETVKKKKNNARKEDGSDKRMILFATEGIGIAKPMLFGDMVNEFFNFARNQEQNFCKAYARLDLGLSRTVPTFIFKPSQILRIRDTFSNDTPEASEFNDPNLDWSELCEKPQVMNDGCARVSVGAALKIWELYQSATGSDEPFPSAFQGRIGGAKGMWMVSSEPHTRNQADQGIWIEITDSQLKFEPTQDDEDDDLYNFHRLTFNYLKHSFVNGSTDLHISFIPILVDRGVERDVIASFIISRLDEERKQLLEMLHDPVKLHNWVTKQGSATPASGILPWQAALPVSLPEKVKLLLRTGFSPNQCPYLAKTLERFIKLRQTWMEQKLQAPLGRATFLLGLADPEKLLNPGEVHIHFSSPFLDEFTRKTYRHLDGLEVLVARQPACRPSDIQKVRAISHPRLSHLVDVIVFPVQGQFPLAGKLQGGDYDGDTFWTCWEPDLVDPFRNAPAPLKTPDPAKYGITKDIRKLHQVMDVLDLSTADDFLREVLDFRTAQSLLGIATNRMESVAYHENRISSHRIDALCDVHDLLVDAPKNAYRFDESDFQKLVRYQLKCGNPKVPAYKQAMEASAKIKDIGEGEKDFVKNLRHKSDNILDYVYFDIIRKHNTETRKQLRVALPKEVEDDTAIQLPFLQLRNKNSQALDTELRALLTGIEKIVQDWNRSLGDKSDLTSDKYKKLLEGCYDRFRSLLPSAANASDPDIAPLINPYLGLNHQTLWEIIRASALYTTHPKKLAFIWHMAGREYAQIKARGDPDSYSVAPGVFADLKTKPNKVPKSEEEEESEDEFESAMEQITG